MAREPRIGEELGRLMRQSQTGDESAYADLLVQVSVLVRGVVRNRMRGLQAADVEDLVQEVLISLHQVRATFDPMRPFLPWLMTIVQSRLTDTYRKVARRAAHEILPGELPDPSSQEMTYGRSESFGDEELLWREIRDLPTLQRQAIELLKLRELSLKEASAESGQTIANLKVLVHRAIKTLRSRLVTAHDE
jgi:RNA polymerase sigma-70 factor (ECF subfamily)